MNVRNRRVALFLGLIVLSVGAAHADPFMVTNTSDSGAGSLRQAILDANATAMTCQPQSILFKIPGAGVHTIQPMSELPPFQVPITLDGYSQSGSSMNTMFAGENAQLMIELDGSFAGSSNGLVVSSLTATSIYCSGNTSIIDGLVINRFALAGIYMQGSKCADGTECSVGAVTIYGSFIGTDVTGTLARGNGIGLHFSKNSQDNVVGNELPDMDPSPFTRNVISGNASDGVYLESSIATVPSLAHGIRNNYIGVDATGTLALPNGRHGVFCDVGSAGTSIVDNLISSHPSDGVVILDGPFGVTTVHNNGIGIGVNGEVLGNAGDGVHVGGVARGVTVGGYFQTINTGQPTIANNTGAGVYAEDNTSVDVFSARIGHNGGLGIDLAPRGVNVNDVLDVDTGPNELLNMPVLDTPTFVSGSSTVNVTGSIDTSANTDIEIDIYRNDACDPSGFGEGQVSIGPIKVTTDASGHGTFASQFQFLSAGTGITALSRRVSTADSTIIVSEFSNCRVIGDPIFANGFQ